MIFNPPQPPPVDTVHVHPPLRSNPGSATDTCTVLNVCHKNNYIPECQFGWSYIGDHCYKFSFDDDAYRIARDKCAEHDSYVIVTETLDERDAVISFANMTSKTLL